MSGFGWARLELVARGVGELQVRAPQLFHRVEPDEPVTAPPIDLVNEGTAELRNIEIDATVPLGWSRQIDPPLIKSLDVGEESRVTITLEPDGDVTPGRYESRIRTQALSDSQPIEGEDKLLTVEISPPVNLLGTSAPTHPDPGIGGWTRAVRYSSQSPIKLNNNPASSS